MTDIQRADLEAGRRGAGFNTDESIPLATINDDSLPLIIAGITTQIKAVEDAETAQQHDAGDVAKEKETLKEMMGKTVIKFALRGEVKAQMLGLEELETALQHPLTFITQADGSLAVTRAKDMMKTMDDNKGPAGPLKNITALNISEINTAIGKFSGIENKPTNIIKEKKAQGTDKIQPDIDLLNGWVNLERKLLHSYWDGGVNQGLVDEFDLKTHPIILGTKHNIVLAHLLKDEDGTAIIDGKFLCLRNEKFADGDGFTDNYEIIGIRSGMANFVASAEGRVPVEIPVNVEKSKKVEIIIRLKLTPPPPPIVEPTV